MFKIQTFKSLFICVICYFMCVICGYAQDPKEPITKQDTTATQGLTPLTPIPFDGSIDRIISKLPPPAYFSFYNLLSNGSFESWTESILDNWSEEGLISQSTDKYLDAFSLTLTDLSNISQNLIDFNHLKDKNVVFGCWVKPSALDQVKLSIDDGTETFSGYNTTTDNWEFLTLTKKINPEATKLTIKIINDKEGTTTLIDAACLYEITPQGSICFTPNPSDNIQMPANLIYTDLEYKKVGIGKVPDILEDYKLDVAGNINASGSVLSAGSELLTQTSADLLYLNETGEEVLDRNLTINGDLTATKLFGDGSGLSGISTSNPWLPTASEDGVYYQGKVGVGTANPQQQLHLYRDAGNEYDLRIGYTTGYNLKLGYFLHSEYGSIQAYKSSESDYSNIAINPLGGNVGIGTTGPNSKLDVVDLSVTSGEHIVAQFYPGSRTDGSVAIGYVADGTTDTYGFVRSRHDIDLGLGAGGSNYVFIKQGGNVGIGTTGPRGTLHVANSAFESTALFERSGQTQDIVPVGARVLSTKTSDMGDGFGALIAFNIQDDAAAINPIGYIGAVRAGADNTGDIVFRPISAGTSYEKMRITSAGNVGIGTMDPGTNKLYVNGNTYINGTLASKSLTTGGDCIFVSSISPFISTFNTTYTDIADGRQSLIQWRGYTAAGGGHALARIYAAHEGSGADEKGYMWFGTNAGNDLWYPTERMRINSVGNVGIGTTEPSFITAGYGGLHISKPYASLKLQSTTGGTTGEWFMGAGGMNIGTQTNTLLAFFTNATERMSITAGGNVYIGTYIPLDTDDTAKLQVAGSVFISGNINAKYQDVAEWVESKQKLEPGTVVILDSNSSNKVLASNTAYDTKVAGVVSYQPGLSLGEKGDNKYQISHSGRVKTRVSAKFGAIQVGDLLVTSSEAGVAMKSNPKMIDGDPFHRPGTILGKALEPLDEGAGEILVLLSLQ